MITILITSLTTIAGLFSLAAGLAGKSLVWGAVATAIVWGLAFSTVLTLIMIPLLYHAEQSAHPSAAPCRTGAETARAGNYQRHPAVLDCQV
ncbi:MAG: efflux RND transporter permease subunit [Burkholderiales bacterium]|nr:efflux RND transporter permease subunit [Burkholderiales bacterium]